MTSLHFESMGTISDSVRAVETEDGAVLLDIRQGLCLSLTPVGVRIWQLLRRQTSVDQIVRCLADEFQDVARTEIHADTLEFISDLRSKSLLVSGEQLNSPRPVPKLLALAQQLRRTHVDKRARAPHVLFLSALFWLVAFDLFRFGEDFARIHTFVKTWLVSSRKAPADTVERACRAVNYACVCYPKRVLCLQRSVATTCLLRSHGVPAQMVIGAQKFPFKGHAWTEVNGSPINERRDVKNVYLVWERC
jgi:hypothetical protein